MQPGQRSADKTDLAASAGHQTALGQLQLQVKSDENARTSRHTCLRPPAGTLRRPTCSLYCALSAKAGLNPQKPKQNQGFPQGVQGLQLGPAAAQSCTASAALADLTCQTPSTPGLGAQLGQSWASAGPSPGPKLIQQRATRDTQGQLNTQGQQKAGLVRRRTNSQLID